MSKDSKKVRVWICLTNTFDIPEEFRKNQQKIEKVIPKRITALKTHYDKMKREDLLRAKL